MSGTFVNFEDVVRRMVLEFKNKYPTVAFRGSFFIQFVSMYLFCHQDQVLGRFKAFIESPLWSTSEMKIDDTNIDSVREWMSKNADVESRKRKRDEKSLIKEIQEAKRQQPVADSIRELTQTLDQKFESVKKFCAGLISLNSAADHTGAGGSSVLSELVNGQVRDLQSERDQLKEEKLRLDAQVQDMNSQMAILTEERNNLRGRVSELEGKVDTMCDGLDPKILRRFLVCHNLLIQNDILSSSFTWGLNMDEDNAWLQYAANWCNEFRKNPVSVFQEVMKHFTFFFELQEKWKQANKHIPKLCFAIHERCRVLDAPQLCIEVDESIKNEMIDSMSGEDSIENLTDYYLGDFKTWITNKLDAMVTKNFA